MVNVASIINANFDNILLATLVVIIILIILTFNSVEGVAGNVELVAALVTAGVALTVTVLHKFPNFIPASLSS